MTARKTWRKFFDNKNGLLLWLRINNLTETLRKEDYAGDGIGGVACGFRNGGADQCVSETFCRQRRDRGSLRTVR